MQSSQAEVIAKKYQLGALIHVSDLSWVYEASFVETSRKARQLPLILKTIPRMRQDEGKIISLRAHVRSEAQALTSLNNPFIVKAIEYGEAAAMPYLVMRRRSMNLSQYLQAKGKLPLLLAIPLLHNLATALDYAHQQGFIHRDIKPDNILLDLDASGQPLYAYITDFGIAQFQERSYRTETNQIIGTMAYMPPERLEGRETTSVSDVYSFGLVAYEMLAGVSLFRQVEAVQEQINLILNPSPEFLQASKAKLDPDVASVIFKAIARKPQDRYPTATQFAESLGQLLPASQLAIVNEAIARNLREAGLADELALMPDEKETFKFSVLWISILVLCFFGIGFLGAQLMLKNFGDDYPTPVVVAPTASAAVREILVPTISSSTATLTDSPEPSDTPIPTTRPSDTPSPTSSPTLTKTLTATPTITDTPSTTPTPRPEVDCLGAAWVYHHALSGDTLSYYVYSLFNHPAFNELEGYEPRAELIRLVNDDIDFGHLGIGDLVCLPAVPPPYMAPSPTPRAIEATAIPTNPETSSSSGGGNSSGGTSSGGNGGGGQASQVPSATSVPTAIPINVAVSSSCANGNSGGTTFTLRNNGSTTVNISWRLMQGSTQIANGNLSLVVGQSSTAWSGTTKNKSYTLTVNETGASSGETCG